MTKARVNADNASADIQGVTAGTGISGGGTSGTVTITNDMATAIDAKGDLVVGTGADTYDNLAVGSNGETLVADSSTSSGLRYQGNFAAGKNKIINGDFGIWQRGTTLNAVANGVYTADRYKVSVSGTSTVNISAQALPPAAITGYDSPYFFRYAISSIGTGTDGTITQLIENVQNLAGQTVTFSFWAKADSARGLAMFAFQNFGSGGSTQVTTTLGYATTTTGWARYSVTAAIPSISGKTIGTSSYLGIQIYFATTAGLTLDTWGWQVEASNTATAFQTATGTIQGELAACQRYYYRFTAPGVVAFFGSATNPSTTQGNAWVQHPVTMRATPTSVDSASLCIREASGTRRSMSSIVLETGGTNTNLAFIYGTISGGTVNIAAQLTADNTTAAYIGFSAEL